MKEIVSVQDLKHSGFTFKIVDINTAIIIFNSPVMDPKQIIGFDATYESYILRPSMFYVSTWQSMVNRLNILTFNTILESIKWSIDNHWKLFLIESSEDIKLCSKNISFVNT